jgi:hypothetical protein
MRQAAAMKRFAKQVSEWLAALCKASVGSFTDGFSHMLDAVEHKAGSNR